MIFKKIKRAVKDNKYLLIKKAIRLETFQLDFNFDSMLAMWSKNNSLYFETKQMVGQIFIQPTRTAEFIVLDFVILPTGAAFPE